MNWGVGFHLSSGSFGRNGLSNAFLLRVMSCGISIQPNLRIMNREWTTNGMQCVNHIESEVMPRVYAGIEIEKSIYLCYNGARNS